MKAKDLLNEGEFGGVVVRKGTVGPFFVDAKVWLDTASDSAHRQGAERDIVDALPSLRALGLFDICSVRAPALQRLIDSV